MLSLDKLWSPPNRILVLSAAAIMIVAIALVDWWTLPYVSLGFLYLFPIMLAAGFLPRPALIVLGIVCGILSEVFSSLDSGWRISRLILETLALTGCGLFVFELLRNRRLSLESQQRLRALVETSPAAIVTVDQNGVVELANQAARDLMLPREPNLLGQSIGAFVPQLESALHARGAPHFRASMQCQVHRGSGETVPAEIWFSTYQEASAPKLAAIIAEISDEQPPNVAHYNVAHYSENGAAPKRLSLNDRQTAVLRLVLEGRRNAEIATRLDMTTSAVKNTLQQLFLKAGVNNRSQLVRVALERYRDLL